MSCGYLEVKVILDTIVENRRERLGTKESMVWQTSLGIRSLQGTEAELYLSTMQDAVEYIDVMGDELDVKTGDRIFDSANFQQKVIHNIR